MSRQSEHSREWSSYCSYNFHLPPKTEPLSQQAELYDSDTLSTDVLHNDMSAGRESSSTSDSLYAPPSPRTLRCVAHNRSTSQYISLCDVPPLRLDGSSDAAVHCETSTSNRAPSTVFPPTQSYPYYSSRGTPAAPALLPSDPIPKGSLRVLNRDPPPLIVSSSTPLDGNSWIRLKVKPTRATIGSTNLFTEEMQKRPIANLQAHLNEKRRVNAELDDVTQQLQRAFKDFSEAQERDGSKQLASPLIINGQSASAQCRSVFDAPPPGKVLAGAIRLPNCYSCMCNETARHLHDIEDENRYKENLERQAEEQLLQRRKREKERLRAQEELRRQTQSTWSGPGSPIIARTPTMTWIEDVRDTCPGSSIPLSVIAFLSDRVLTASRLSRRMRI